MRHLCASLAVALPVLGGVVAAQDDPPDELEKRIRALVVELRNLGIDPTTDGLVTLIEKQVRAEERIRDFGAELVGDLARTDDIGADYVRFLAASAPRLSGRIVTVGPAGDHPQLDAAPIGAGDTVVLAPGRHRLPPSAEFADVAFVGADRETVVLTGCFDTASRVRLDNLTIDCGDSPFLDLRSGGSVQLRDCSLGNYNSGAGGSNAVFGVHCVVLVERCRFDGEEGRAKAPGRFGNAFDLRGRFALYARDCEFVANSEIVRATSQVTFEDCRAERLSYELSVERSTGPVFARGNHGLFRGRLPESVGFALPTDSRAVVEHLLDPSAALDARVADMAESLGLQRDLRYWGALLRHADPEVRLAAVGRLGSLLRREMPDLEAEPEGVDELPASRRGGFVDDIQSGRFLDWLERRRARLVYDDELGHYRAR